MTAASAQRGLGASLTAAAKTLKNYLPSVTIAVTALAPVIAAFATMLWLRTEETWTPLIAGANGAHEVATSLEWTDEGANLLVGTASGTIVRLSANGVLLSGPQTNAAEAISVVHGAKGIPGPANPCPDLAASAGPEEQAAETYVIEAFSRSDKPSSVNGKKTSERCDRYPSKLSQFAVDEFADIYYALPPVEGDQAPVAVTRLTDNRTDRFSGSPVTAIAAFSDGAAVGRESGEVELFGPDAQHTIVRRLLRFGGSATPNGGTSIGDRIERLAAARGASVSAPALAMVTASGRLFVADKESPEAELVDFGAPKSGLFPRGAWAFSAISSMEFSSDGETLLLRRLDGSLALVRALESTGYASAGSNFTRSWRLLAVGLGAPLSALDAALSADGKTLAIAATDDSIRIIDVSDAFSDSGHAEEIAEIHGHSDLRAAMSLSPDGTKLAVADFDGVLSITDLTFARMVWRWESPLRLMRPATPILTQKFASVPTSATSLPKATQHGSAPPPAGPLAEALHKSTPTSNEAKPQAPPDAAQHVSTPPSAVPSSAAPTGPSDLYDRPVLAIDPGMHTATIWDQAVDAAGRFAVTGGADRTVRIWSVTDGKLLRTIWIPVGAGNVGTIYTVAISPDGSTIAAGGWTERRDGPCPIYLFERESGKLIRRISGDLPQTTKFLTFSPDGRYLVATQGGREGLRVFDRDKNWSETFRDDQYGDDSYGAAFARDGRLATTSSDGLIRLYQYDPKIDNQNFRRIGEPVRAPSGNHPFRLAFSPDGKRLAVGYSDVAAVDVLNGTTLQRVDGHRPAGVSAPVAGLVGVAWSGDGRTLFAAGAVQDAQQKTFLFAWDQGGLGSEQRMTYCAADTAAGIDALPQRRILVSAEQPCLGVMDERGNPIWNVPSPILDVRGKPDEMRLSGDSEVIDFGVRGSVGPAFKFDIRSLTLSGSPSNDGLTAGPRTDGLQIEGWRNGASPSLRAKALSLEPYEFARSLAIAPDAKRFFLGSSFALAAYDDAGAQKWRRRVATRFGR